MGDQGAAGVALAEAGPDLESEPKDSGPKPRPRRRRRPSWRQAAVATAGLGVVVGAGVLLSMQSPLPIGAINIDGASADLEPQVTAAVGSVVGESFSSVSAEEAESRITAIDGVVAAKLGWTWWNTLSVVVSEQTPTAVIAAPAGGFLVVDAAGQTIRTGAERPSALPLIEAPVAAGRDAALRVAQQIPPEMAGQIDAVIGASATSVSLRLPSGAIAILGDPTDLAVKFPLVRQLAPTGAAQINVSVPERPAVKGIPAPPEPPADTPEQP